MVVMKGDSNLQKELAKLWNTFQANTHEDIREGLILCKELGLTRAIIESDEKDVVETINKKAKATTCCAVYKEIEELLNQEWEIRIEHV